MRTRIGVVVIVGLLVAADPDKGDAVKQEIAKLEGSWKGTVLEHKGKRPLSLAWTLVIKGDKYTLKAGEKVTEDGTFKLDPTQKPKTVDLTSTRGKARLGIYELEGGRAKACFASAGNKNRPNELATKAEADEYLWEFQRD